MLRSRRFSACVSKHGRVEIAGVAMLRDAAFGGSSG